MNEGHVLHGAMYRHFEAWLYPVQIEQLIVFKIGRKPCIDNTLEIIRGIAESPNLKTHTLTMGMRRRLGSVERNVLLLSCRCPVAVLLSCRTS